MDILRAQLLPVLDDILNADTEDIEALVEFSDTLMKKQLDNGLQYQVCNALVAYARQESADKRIVYDGNGGIQFPENGRRKRVRPL